jgi:ABC-type transport system substrate-binding protein
MALGIVAMPLAGNTQAGAERHLYTIPHVLRFSGAEDIVGLNPHFTQQTVTGYLDRLTMAYLVRFDAANRPIPELATEVPTRKNGGISADGLTITYHLRHDAKWSDGQPFTSADVAFSVDVVKNPKNNEIAIDDFLRITRVDTPGPYRRCFTSPGRTRSSTRRLGPAARGHPCCPSTSSAASTTSSPRHTIRCRSVSGHSNFPVGTGVKPLSSLRIRCIFAAGRSSIR